MEIKLKQGSEMNNNEKSMYIEQDTNLRFGIFIMTRNYEENSNSFDEEEKTKIKDLFMSICEFDSEEQGETKQFPAFNIPIGFNYFNLFHLAQRYSSKNSLYHIPGHGRWKTKDFDSSYIAIDLSTDMRNYFQTIENAHIDINEFYDAFHDRSTYIFRNLLHYLPVNLRLDNYIEIPYDVVEKPGTSISDFIQTKIGFLSSFDCDNSLIFSFNSGASTSDAIFGEFLFPGQPNIYKYILKYIDKTNDYDQIDQMQSEFELYYVFQWALGSMHGIPVLILSIAPDVIIVSNGQIKCFSSNDYDQNNENTLRAAIHDVTIYLMCYGCCDDNNSIKYEKSTSQNTKSKKLEGDEVFEKYLIKKVENWQQSMMSKACNDNEYLGLVNTSEHFPNFLKVSIEHPSFYFVRNKIPKEKAIKSELMMINYPNLNALQPMQSNENYKLCLDYWRFTAWLRYFYKGLLYYEKWVSKERSKIFKLNMVLSSLLTSIPNYFDLSISLSISFVSMIINKMIEFGMNNSNDRNFFTLLQMMRMSMGSDYYKVVQQYESTIPKQIISQIDNIGGAYQTIFSVTIHKHSRPLSPSSFVIKFNRLWKKYQENLIIQSFDKLDPNFVSYKDRFQFDSQISF